jgi:hypothetical protein
MEKLVVEDARHHLASDPGHHDDRQVVTAPPAEPYTVPLYGSKFPQVDAYPTILQLS